MSARPVPFLTGDGALLMPLDACRCPFEKRCATPPDNGALLASMAPLKTGDGALLAGDGARMTGDRASANIATPWPGVFASMPSNNSLLLDGGAPLACGGAHPSGFRLRMAIVRDLLAKESVSLTRNHFFLMKAAHPDQWPRPSIS